MTGDSSGRASALLAIWDMTLLLRMDVVLVAGLVSEPGL
jgi:hypothetical protein